MTADVNDNAAKGQDALAPRVARLRDLPSRLVNAKNLQSGKKEAYDSKGEKGKVETTPSPNSGLSEEDLRKYLVACVQGLSGEKLEELKGVLAGSSLANEFGLASRVSPENASLPTEAPALWAERTSGREVSPSDFIRLHYGAWIENGLTRAHIKTLDEPLYNAFAQWIRRHPEDDFDPDAKRKRQPYKDPEEAVDRIRRQKREWAAQHGPKT